MKNLASRLFYIIAFAGLLYFLSQYFLVEEFTGSLDELRNAEIFTLEELQSIQQDSESLQLALAGIHIVQGNNSKEEWTLDAQWANYSAENGDVTVHKPFISFFDDDISEENNTITAKGETGRLINDNTLIILQDNVVLNQDTIQIDTVLLEYNTENRFFYFPQSAYISSPSMHGQADYVEWDTINNRIQARENVVFIFNDDNKDYSHEKTENNVNN